MNEKNQGTAHPNEWVNSKQMENEGTKQGTASHNEGATSKAQTQWEEYQAKRAQELNDTLPRPSALSPEKIQGLRISEETATWLSAYTKVQELYDWIYYAYVYRYSDSAALNNMVDDGVHSLWSELADKVMKLAGDSIADNLCSLDERKL
jgi:hypothetical protein